MSGETSGDLEQTKQKVPTWKPKAKLTEGEEKETKKKQSTDAFPEWHFKSKTQTTVPRIIPVII